MTRAATNPWRTWAADPDARRWTLGVEEEILLVEPPGWNLAQAADEVLPRLPRTTDGHANPETHAGALELATGVHGRVADAAAELRTLRASVSATTGELGLSAATAGTHPFTVWRETNLGHGDRQDEVYDSMRELARREPSFALHVHLGVPDPDDAIRLLDRMRVHLPTVLALSANSPFWQGRHTGLASVRTPLFQAFPRVGLPRRFGDYATWVDAISALVDRDAFPDPTYLWWDVRPQPRLGTVEIRVCDAQTTVTETTALVALIQCLGRHELEEGDGRIAERVPQELLEENRFIAARDGARASLLDPDERIRRPLEETVPPLLERLRPHAEDLGCLDELAVVGDLLAEPSARRQATVARGEARLPGLVAWMAGAFGAADRPPAAPAEERSAAAR
ncbi:MAG: YbdK family carboxylate-amine ligase [Solirubrobacteraceae bacterium]